MYGRYEWDLLVQRVAYQITWNAVFNKIAQFDTDFVYKRADTNKNWTDPTTFVAHNQTQKFPLYNVECNTWKV